MRLYLSSSSGLKSSYANDDGQTLYVANRQHEVVTIKKNLPPARTSDQTESSGNDVSDLQLAHLADIEFKRLIIDGKEHEASEFLRRSKYR